MLFKLLLFVFATATVTKALPFDELDTPQAYPRFIQFPDGEGVMHDVDLEEEPDNDLLEEIEGNPANNVYLLYTRRNLDAADILVYNDPATVYASNFNARKPVVVIVHGWLSNQNSGLNSVISEAVLENEDANVIVLDWRRLARANYITATRGVPSVGRGLGLFLRFLNKITGLPYSNVHLVGFSLGAHLVGSAGRELEGQVARITGLDPAGPLWNLNSNRLNADDAVYVEAHHTNGGYDGLGIGYAVADADFFVNGGRSQPGCLTLVCDHNRAWRLFASTVVNDHLVGRECDSFLQINLNRCRGDELALGNNDLNKTGSGRFRVNTRRRYPY